MRNSNLWLVGMLLCISLTTHAQRNATRFAIHGIGTPTPDFKGSLLFGKFEFFISPYSQRKKTNWFLSVGYLRIADSEVETRHMPSLKAGFLMGESNHQFECQFGFIYIPDLEFVCPSAQVGYRYQPARSGLIFRAGIGLPEPIYATIGYSF